MHRALCISEILREVLLYAAEQCISDANRGSRNVCPWHAHGDEFSSCVSSCMYDIDDNKRRSTPRHRFLRAVALSCKTFSGVALDLLWCVLDSSEPLRDLQKYLISEVCGLSTPAMTHYSGDIGCSTGHAGHMQAILFIHEPYSWRVLGDGRILVRSRAQRQPTEAK